MAWFSILPVFGIFVLVRVGGWYAKRLAHSARVRKAKAVSNRPTLSRGRVAFSMAVLIALVFSKYVYLVSLTNYYTFYLIDRFGLTKQAATINLFIFLFAVAAGTIMGGPLGDRFGRKYVIWFSILGVAPFSIALPHMGLTGTIVLSVIIGVVLASAFSAILVFGQELIPGNVGMVAGIFFGLAFFISGVAAVELGNLADKTSITHVFHICGYLPLIPDS